MGVLDKIKKFKNSRPTNEGGRSRMMGIFHDWQDGANHIRLIGEFLEVKTHFIAPAPKRNERGLCQQTAFSKDNDDRLPQVINCPDWDIENEQEKETKTCPICKLHRLAVQALKEGPDEEETKYLKNLASLARQRTNLKWNIFDRQNPNVKHIDESNNEEDKKGLKIASIGMEAWNDIEGIFEQCGFDITDPEEGVDINVIKGHNGTRTSYSAQVILNGKELKVTPFDAEEKEIVAGEHDLKSICGRQTDADKVLDALHGDYRDLLDVNEDDNTAIPENEPVAPKPSPKAPSTSFDDDDDFLSGTEKKK
jgi:hypothetical protein